MSTKIVFHDLEDFCRLYRDGWPEARMARHFSVSRPVVRRIIQEQGLPPRGYFDSNRFLAAERSFEERRAYAKAANIARRGSKSSRAELERRANGRVQTSYYVGLGEQIIADALQAAGLTIQRQLPEGKFNLDIACWPIAVEVDRCTASPIKKNSIGPKRLRYLRRRGWSILFVHWNARGPKTFADAELRSIVAAVKMGRRNRWQGSRVIRCGFQVE